MLVLAADSQGIARAAGVLQHGGVAAFPTETVYGLGALAFMPQAVARIFEIKRRPHFDPLIVHVLDEAMLSRVVASMPRAGQALCERFWPGPLTLVLQKRPEVPDLVTAGLPTVAVRMPSHPVARALLDAAGGPLAAPSANPFGRLSPTRADHVACGIGDEVDVILDGGPTEHGLESTIVAVDGRPELLRHGAIESEAIEAIVGPLDAAAAPAFRAPGMLPQHYAPVTPVRLVEPSEVLASERARAAALALSDEFEGYAVTRRLSASSDLREAAARFFETLHEIDALGLDRIDAQPIPERGLGRAMMDRLRRAAAERRL